MTAETASSGGLNIAVLVKQIPRFETMEMTATGRLKRDGVELGLNAYCRRAVAKGVELARESGGRCTVFTLGPDAAEMVLREGVAWGAHEGVLVSDPAFAGSDTLATSRALAAALAKEGPFDVVLAGRNSVDADTGQVGPAVAELLDLPFLGGVRELNIKDGRAHARCEHDDGWLDASAALPVVLSVAERLCAPAKSSPEDCAAVLAERLRRLNAADLGPGPWGAEGSPTRVGEVRALEDTPREGRRLNGALEDQVREAVSVLVARGALTNGDVVSPGAVPPSRGTEGPTFGVVIEPGREGLGAELCGTAATLAADIGGHVVALMIEPLDGAEIGAWGADAGVVLDGAVVEEDIAAAVAQWAEAVSPWAILGPGTMWGREVVARAGARLDAGLTGDAIALEQKDGRLVAWKSAFGGKLVAAITATSPIQMATVRAGSLPHLDGREAIAMVTTQAVEARGRIDIHERTRDDELDALAVATRVVGVGQGVPGEELARLDGLTGALGAELAATRKITDQGWLPRARQIGITGRSIGPRLYIALGLSGKFNHSVGIRRSGTVLAVNSDPEAMIFDLADVGIVGDWREVAPLLADELKRNLGE
jgi:electron transfer flavoprotein alpha subunit